MKRLVVLALVAACGDNGVRPGADAGRFDGNTVDAPAAMLELTDSHGQLVAQLTFGTVGVGETATAQLRLTNTGLANSSPILLAVTGPNVGDFAIDSLATTCGGALAPQQTCAITIDCIPSALGPRSASLAIGASSTMLTVPLVVDAISDLSFTPTTYDFTKVRIGAGPTQTLLLQNTTALTLPIDAMNVSGDASFTIASSTCGLALPGGATCDITLEFTPTALGTVTGQLDVTSGTSMYSASLMGDGAYSVTVDLDGTGMGTVTSSPAGLDCTTVCAALFDGDVTLTATPDASSVFVAWSDPSCGSSATCTVNGSTTSVTEYAQFAPMGGTGSVQVTFAGSGTGEVDVDVYDGHTDTIVPCTASCSVPTAVGDSVSITAWTPSTYGGITGSCTDTITGACSYTAPFGASAVTVTFTADPAEQWTQYFADGVIAVAHDTDGNVIVATATSLVKLTSGGANVWTIPLVVSGLATGPSDSIYVVVGSNVEKLDATGSVLWTSALDADIAGGCPQQCVAVGSDGSVAVKGASYGLALWDTTGTELWATTVGGDFDGLAIDATGVVYAVYDDAAIPNVHRFQPDGTELPDWDGSITGWQGIADEYPGTINFDADGELLASWQGFEQSGFQRTRTDGSLDYARTIDDDSAETQINGVTASSVGRIAWWYNWGDGSAGTNYYIYVFTDDNTDVWSLHRVSTAGQPNDASYYGSQLVIGGSFCASTCGGFVQAFSP